MLVEGDQADGDRVGDGDVHEPFGNPAGAAMGHAIAFQVVAGGEFAGVGLIGDDAQRSGLGRCAEQRALRPRQCLDTRHVVDMHIQRAADGGNGQFVQIRAHRRQRAGMVAFGAAGDAAHVDGGLVRPIGLRGYAGQEFQIVLKFIHVLLLELLGIQHLHAHRHFLQLLGTFFRGDDHLFDAMGGLWQRGGRRGLCPRR